MTEDLKFPLRAGTYFKFYSEYWEGVPPACHLYILARSGDYRWVLVNVITGGAWNKGVEHKGATALSPVKWSQLVGEHASKFTRVKMPWEGKVG